jgi:hypothetical protein
MCPGSRYAALDLFLHGLSGCQPATFGQQGYLALPLRAVVARTFRPSSTAARWRASRSRVLVGEGYGCMVGL